MKLEFNRKSKDKMVGVRLTMDEYQKVKELAEDNDVSVGEACRVLINAALKELK